MNETTRASPYHQIKKIEDVTYELDVREAIDREILEFGFFELSTAAALSRLCLPGSTVLDIGANIGAHTFHLAKKVGETGRVIAFEPTTYAFTKLYRNMLLNNFNNVRLERMALSDTSGVMELAFNSSWRSEGSELPPVQEAMLLMTLDEYMRRYAVGRVDLIKLDVDGYEVKILRGGKETIAKYRPHIVTELCAYALQQQGETVMNLLHFLSALGYRFFGEQTYELLEDLPSIAASVPADSSINVLAIHPV